MNKTKIMNWFISIDPDYICLEGKSRKLNLIFLYSFSANVGTFLVLQFSFLGRKLIRRELVL